MDYQFFILIHPHLECKERGTVSRGCVRISWRTRQIIEATEGTWIETALIEHQIIICF